jgi:hypothetical protein
VNNYFGVLQAVLNNLGIGVLPDYLTEDFPDLVRVLPDVESAEVPVFLAYPEELRQSKRIEAFRDFVTEEIIAYRHGLKPDEYQRILEIIGREPSFTELGIFSAMWNEHCSYKSSKKWLRTLPTEGPQVICGPGRERRRRRYRRRAGGGLQDGEPQPPLLHRALPGRGDRRGRHPARRLHHGRAAHRGDERAELRRAGPPQDPQLVHGVVEGIGGYGNCFGVPTVGGEVRFHPAYNGNCLVNAFAAGLADADKIFYSAASGVGMPVVYLGAKTGRDGVGGATMASAEFDDTIEEKRPTVQVGDPFTEKRLLEACLELMADRRGDLDPGHGRGGPDLLGGRDGRQGRAGHPARPRPRAAARRPA